VTLLLQGRGVFDSPPWRWLPSFACVSAESAGWRGLSVSISSLGRRRGVGSARSKLQRGTKLLKCAMAQVFERLGSLLALGAEGATRLTRHGLPCVAWRKTTRREERRCRGKRPRWRRLKGWRWMRSSRVLLHEARDVMGGGDSRRPCPGLRGRHPATRS
jgi:hypothetical protein